MDLRPVGVNGILAVLGDSISEQTGAQVAALREAIADAHISSVEETIPAYASLLVKYDPFLTDYAALCDRLRALEKRLSASAVQTGKIVEIPVCYGGVYGEDLPFVAKHAGLSEKEVVALHSGQPYRIYMLGFLPGFPYLGGLNERLHTPRLSTPRTKIPAGSVGSAANRRASIRWNPPAAAAHRSNAADALCAGRTPALCGGRPHPVCAHR